MIFTDASPKSLHGIKSALVSFGEMSSLRVSYEKSEIFCSRVHDQKALADIIGLRIGSLPVRHLGVPLISGKLSSADCRALVDKITGAAIWTVRFLFYAGRLQLVSSILTSMHNYWCDIFMLPKKVIKDVERTCNSFLWNGSVGSVVGAKVGWKAICSPKCEGGLGLRNIEDWNKAYLTRIIWFLFAWKNTLWIAWVNHNLLKGRSFWTVNPPMHASSKKLLKLRELVRPMIAFKVGNGEYFPLA